MSSVQVDVGDDKIDIVDDLRAFSPLQSRPWRVLIVDDDSDVHESTRFALKNVTILGRPLELIHAYSAAEAMASMTCRPDIAVALVDVVMETPDAGLQLVRQIREAGFHAIRVVLRTGQPGYAPEQSVISLFEIDDYQTKSGLTRSRLLTVLTTGIRAYDQIQTITRDRAGLEAIVESSNKLFQCAGLEPFAECVLTQIAVLLDIQPNGVVCLNGGVGTAGHGLRVIAGAGRFERYIGKSFVDFADPVALNFLHEARERQAPLLRDGFMALNFESDAGCDLSVFMETPGDIAATDVTLIKLFSANVAIGFENLSLLGELDRLAYIDPVLDVPNMNAFEVALGAKLASEEGGRMALLSLDHFSSIFADYGTKVSHRLLAAVYADLNGAGGQDLMVARVGDATFALLGDRDAVDEARLMKIFDKPFVVDGIDIPTKATTTIIDLAGVGADPNTILRTASAALRHLKRVGRGRCAVYDSKMRTDLERRGKLQDALKVAVERGEGFAVHLQPKVNLESGEVTGAEALLRWQHEETAVSPAEFIPIAESCGLTQSLTDFVVHSVGEWQARSEQAKALPISINLSMADLNNPDFSKRLLHQVESAGLSPGEIEFEITEGIAMGETDWAVRQVQMLKDAGFGIALDDFGTGYSSLGHFDQLPIDTLKIDRRFITQLDLQTAPSSLAAVFLSMTHALQVDCVAEGIETEEQLKALKSLGCNSGQGYLFGRPVPMDEFDSLFLPQAAE